MAVPPKDSHRFEEYCQDINEVIQYNVVHFIKRVQRVSRVYPVTCLPDAVTRAGHDTLNR
ncbi:hypothetical protein E2C01_016036 [Portunus trituberculatus]|uniref:Uncharacterized protein n=1 Tax=Portunus trituberculatus TaxID=210409 RepID=A0A5B7DPP4_PORTR|nr:hypothetical protein [Portunus trituberculatus]